MERLFVTYGLSETSIAEMSEIGDLAKRPILASLLEGYLEEFPGVLEVTTRHSTRDPVVVMVFFDPHASKKTFDYVMTNINGQPAFTATEKPGDLDRTKGVPIEVQLNIETFYSQHGRYFETLHNQPRQETA